MAGIIWGFVVKYIGPVIWHAVKRFGSWLFIAALIVIIGMRWFGFKKNLCNTCHHNGYSQALTDHPTYGNVGTVTNNNNVVKTAGIEFNNFGFGFWHRR